MTEAATVESAPAVPTAADAAIADSSTPTRAPTSTSAVDLLARVARNEVLSPEIPTGLETVPADAPLEGDVVPLETLAPDAPAQPTADAQGNLHSPEDGKFVPKGGDTAEAAPAAEATEVAEVSDLPDGYVSVPVPEGHPLRDRGVTELTGQEGQAGYLRHALNATGENAEMRTHMSRLVRERNDALRSVAELEAVNLHLQEGGGQQVLSPDDMHVYNDLKTAYPDTDHAEVFMRGKMQEQGGDYDTIRREAGEAHQQQIWRREAESFRDTAVKDAGKSFPHWSEGEVRSQIAAFGAFVGGEAERGVEVPLSPRAWYRFADAMYRAVPAVRAELNLASTTAAESAANGAAAAREADRVARATTSQRINPLSTNAPVETTPGPTPDEEKKPQSFQEMYRNLSDRAKGLVRG